MIVTNTAVVLHCNFDYLTIMTVTSAYLSKWAIRVASYYNIGFFFFFSLLKKTFEFDYFSRRYLQGTKKNIKERGCFS